MWLFKTPKINSKNKKLFVIAHYFELIAIFLIILAVIISFMIKKSIFEKNILYFIILNIAFWSYFIFHLILVYVAFVKKETLRYTRIKHGFTTLGIFGVNENTQKGTLAVINGIIHLVFLIFLFFVYYLFLR